MISVCILTKNCAATLPKTLDSVQQFDEVVILDNGSTDSTLDVARKYPNVRIYQTQFKGFGALRNEAASLAKNDWVLQLDSDETLSSPLFQEIRSLSLNASFAYRMARHNFYNGKRIYGCGWGGDTVVRLYHRKVSQYSTAAVHESLQASQILPLKSPIQHIPYRSISDFLTKMELYSTLFAEQYQGKKKSTTAKAFAHAVFAFLKGYLFQGGFLSGAEGFTIAHYNATTTFYKYQKLAEKNQRC